MLDSAAKGPPREGAASAARRLVKWVLYAAVSAFSLYMCSCIVQYGLMVLFCTVLLVLGSLLVVHFEGARSRETLWRMPKRERQLFHAARTPFFSIVPLPPRAEGAKGGGGIGEEDDEPGLAPRWAAWTEGPWKQMCHETGEGLTRAIADKSVFEREVAGHVVRPGWPSAAEVERCGNTLVLAVRGLWAGLAARINPVLNAFLNRYVKCWNRSLVWTTVRFSSYGMPYPVVSIDFPTADVATLNFGQKDDCLLMSHIYEHALTMYPRARIVLLSVCLGGLRIMNWLGRNPDPPNLAAVVLESPLASVRHLLRGFIGERWFHEDLYNTFCLIVPNYRPELENQYSFLHTLGPAAHARFADTRHADTRHAGAPDAYPRVPRRRRSARRRTAAEPGAPGAAASPRDPGSPRSPRSSGSPGGAVSAGPVCHAPVFLGMIEGDPFSNPSHLPLYAGRFSDLTVFKTTSDAAHRHHASPDISHGKLYQLPAFRRAARRFLSAVLA
jgi:hypothetical protein